MNKAVFLDKDGTIIEDVNYLKHASQIKFIPGSVEAIKMLNKAGYKVIVISNQSGIARGILTEDMLQAIDKNLHKRLLHQGAYLDGMYHCPHHPEHGLYPYKKECSCRKPNPGMLLKAAKDHDIDLAQSYMIGDHPTDIEAGKKAGTKTIFVLTGHGKEEKDRIKEAPDQIVESLLEAVKQILEK